MNAVIRTARPKQWLKNVLVFAAPGAAGVLNEPDALGKTLLGFVALCLAASGIYFWNDVLDVESDREHPTKCNRPIAAGQLGIGPALVIGSVLPLLALGLAALTGEWKAVAAVAAYIVVTLTYSAIWKHIAVIDLIAISSGFVLRAITGAAVTAVPVSSWFILVTTFGSLFIVTGKRFAESRELGADAGKLRATLEAYSEGYLRFVLAVTVGGALLSYCMWAFETKELSGTDLPYYELSIVPIIAAFLRYALVLENGHGAAPEDVFASDRVLQVLGLVWVVIFALAVYT
ncbi:MAG TPA: decaprenyl-phosphate phosphoribosyltransferase [Ilumatobacter sp.]|nr:decaprenyl-phosphate phosphoribosyltransferase [Ilumatobacter sp.]